MSTIPTYKPKTQDEISSMPFEVLIHYAKQILINSAYTMVHYTDMMMILDEIDARVKSRP